MRRQITNDRIVVRAFDSSDVDSLHEAVCESVDEMSPFETWCHSGYSVEEAAEYIDWWMKARDAGRAFYFAVEDATEHTLLGACGLSGYSTEHRRAMLGYWIRTSRTRRGHATLAARMVCHAGFADLGLLRIEIEVPTTNVASQCVAEKLGAVREGVLRKRLVLPDGPSDVIAYSILQSEWKRLPD